MKDFFDLIGSLATVIIIGAIVISSFVVGKPIIGFLIILAFIVIHFFSKREDNLVAERTRKAKEESDAFDEEKKRIQRIESMPENEFINYVKIHHSELHKILKNGNVIKLGHGISTTRYSTKKYFIDFEIEDNDFTEFITIFRKSDNVKIYSGSWSHG